MRKIWNKGHRIRASDKHLVYHFSIGTLLFIFAAVLLLLNIKQIMRTDWEHFSLLENGLTLSPYNFITILIATGVCALVTFLYYRFCYDSFKKLLHRQKLARMILENKWYEADINLLYAYHCWSAFSCCLHFLQRLCCRARSAATSSDTYITTCSVLLLMAVMAVRLDLSLFLWRLLTRFR